MQIDLTGMGEPEKKKSQDFHNSRGDCFARVRNDKLGIRELTPFFLYMMGFT